MKVSDPKLAKRFEDLPNVGKATAKDFLLLGFQQPQEFIGQDPWALYQRLCALTASRQDPCVLDVLMAAVHFMETGEAKKWWEFTDERKQRFAELYKTH